eukprot:1333610-Amorphochlora_amoeboformis.AAC.1
MKILEIGQRLLSQISPEIEWNCFRFLRGCLDIYFGTTKTFLKDWFIPFPASLANFRGEKAVRHPGVVIERLR